MSADSDDDLGDDSGSAYVYDPDENGGFVETKLTAADGAAGDHFGRALSIVGDLAVVGAPTITMAPAPPMFLNVKGRRHGSSTNGSNNNAFGSRVKILGTEILVGAPGHADPGIKFGFRKGVDGNWTQAYVIPTPAGRG